MPPSSVSNTDGGSPIDSSIYLLDRHDRELKPEANVA